MPDLLDILIEALARERGWLSGPVAPDASPLDVHLAVVGAARPDQIRDLLARQVGTLGQLDPGASARVRSWECVVEMAASRPSELAALYAALREQFRRRRIDGRWTELAELPAVRSEPALPPSSQAQTGPAGAGCAATLLQPGQGPSVAANERQDAGRGSDRTQSATRTDGTASGGDVFAPGCCWGRYQLIEEVGRGGMGVVYRALDLELHREVALKTLHAGALGDRDAVARLQREARTAATLDHPAIVPVYEVGERQGIPYFAMAYVRGQSLEHALAAGSYSSLRERARVVHAVAEVVAYAHSRAVVHRDLKPANILIDEAGELKVMDFGLARRVGETRLTATGQMMGTPDYMPPEQIRGESHRIGPPADVYALGVMFYEMLTGKPPFTGDSVAEVMGRALRDEPVAPRRREPRVPLDLEIICLKAIRKEPGARYPDARALADDLARFLSGEAIQARRETWRERSVRWVRRRPAVAALACLGLLAGVLAGVGWARADAAARARVSAEQAREALTQRVMAEVRERASIYRSAAIELRRAGVPTGGVIKYLEALRKNVTAAEALDPHTGEPRWHLGRLLRAFERFPEAAAAQERALQREPGLVAAHYERAVLAAQRLGERRVELRDEWRRRLGERRRRLGGDRDDAAAPAPEAGTPSDQELARADAESQRLWDVLRTELAVLERSAGSNQPVAASDGPDVLTPAMLCCLRGLNALYSPDATRRKEAQELLDTAVMHDPYLEEAHLVLADLALAGEDAAQASAVLDRALAVDRGHVGLHLRRSQAAHLIALAAERRGDDPRPALRDGLAACERALELRPDDAELLRQRATVHRDAGVWDQSFGSDPAEHYARALADLDRAVALGGDADLADLDRAHLRLNWGVWKGSSGQPPEEPISQWQAGIDAVGRVLENRPDRPDAWRLRAALRLYLAKMKLRGGASPAADLTAAAGDLDQAIALDATDALAWMTRADVFLTRGLDLARHGVDPDTEYDRARADLERVVRLEPHASEPQNRLADLELNRAVFHDRNGSDARPLLKTALEFAEVACARAPGQAASVSLRGRIHMTLAKVCQRHGENPEVFLRAALADLDAAELRSPGSVDVACDRADLLGVQAQNAPESAADAAFAEAVVAADRAVLCAPREARTWRKRGELRELWGGRRLDRGRSPETFLEEAERDLRTALELDAGAAATWFTLGRVLMHLGRDAARRVADPEPAWAAAEAAFDKAADGMPAQAREQRGLLGSFRAEARIGRGLDPDVPLRQAVVEYSEVLRLHPDSRTAWRLRGEAHHLRAVWQMQSGQDPGASAELALADLAEALKRTPGAVAVLRNRALLRTNLGAWRLSHQGDALTEFAAAAQDHAAVAERVPGDASTHKSLAVVLTQVGFLQLDRGQDPGDVLRRARTEFDAALSLGGPDWECRWRRGIASLVLSEWDAAISDLEAAEELAPERAGLWARAIEDARARRAAAAAAPTRQD